jgi:6-phosphogluconolactonase (cycloisomerase 2 family)
MKLSRIGRVSMAFVVSVAMGLGMTACGGGTIGFMWVLGTQYNQIAGFKIDDFTGNLTQVVHSPFTSGGADPVSLVVSTGGRFLYVVNAGTNTTPPSGSESLPCGTGGGVSEFSVGGQGILSFQQCFQVQGTTPLWASLDSTGSFLYVLVQQGPGAVCAPTAGATATSCYGAITVFSIASDTGRLSLVVNQQLKDPTTQQPLTYFPVGYNPTMLAVSSSCVFTLNAGTTTGATAPSSGSVAPTVTPYTAAAGQLTQTTNSNITINATRPTSIRTGGSYIYITDAGAQNTPGQILPFTMSTATACSLNTVVGGPVANLATTSTPAYTVADSTGKYVYVANQSSTNSLTANSTISGFNVLSNGQLSAIPDGANNPYAIGSGPVCMVEDPSDQYLYTSNGDGTVTGKILDRNTGRLSDLTRGSTFTAVPQATCLAVSGNVD